MEANLHEPRAGLWVTLATELQHPGPNANVKVKDKWRNLQKLAPGHKLKERVDAIQLCRSTVPRGGYSQAVSAAPSAPFSSPSAATTSLGVLPATPRVGNTNVFRHREGYRAQVRATVQTPGGQKRRQVLLDEVGTDEEALRQKVNQVKRDNNITTKLNVDERRKDKRGRILSLFKGVYARGGRNKPLHWLAKLTLNNKNEDLRKIFPFTTEGEVDARNWLNEVRMSNGRSPLDVDMSAATLLKTFDEKAAAPKEVEAVPVPPTTASADSDQRLRTKKRKQNVM